MVRRAGSWLAGPEQVTKTMALGWLPEAVMPARRLCRNHSKHQAHSLCELPAGGHCSEGDPPVHIRVHACGPAEVQAKGRSPKKECQPQGWGWGQKLEREKNRPRVAKYQGPPALMQPRSTPSKGRSKGGAPERLRINERDLVGHLGAQHKGAHGAQACC